MRVEGIATNLPLHRADRAGRGFHRRRASTSTTWRRWLQQRRTAHEAPIRHRSACSARARCCSRRPATRTLPTQQRIWALAREAEAWPDVREAVPGMNNLMVSFASRPPTHRGNSRRGCSPPGTRRGRLPLQGRVVELPVVYGGTGGPHMADVVAHTGLSVDEIVERPQRAALSRVRARQPPRLLLPRRHGPAHRDAAAQGAGAEHPGRRGVDRRCADRRVGLRRAERLEHDRQHHDALLRPDAAIRRPCCSPGDSIRFRVEKVIR